MHLKLKNTILEQEMGHRVAENQSVIRFVNSQGRLGVSSVRGEFKVHVGLLKCHLFCGQPSSLAITEHWPLCTTSNESFCGLALDMGEHEAPIWLANDLPLSGPCRLR